MMMMTTMMMVMKMIMTKKMMVMKVVMVMMVTMTMTTITTTRHEKPFDSEIAIDHPIQNASHNSKMTATQAIPTISLSSRLRKVKRDQRKLAENSGTIGDVCKTSSCTYEIVSDMRCWQDGVSTRLCALESQMGMISEQLGRLNDLLTRRRSLSHSPDSVRRRTLVQL